MEKHPRYPKLQKYKQEGKSQVENILVFVIALIFLFISVVLIAFGLIKGGKNEAGNRDNIEIVQNKQIVKDEGSLGDYFKTSENQDNKVDDDYIKDDPFAEFCASVSGDGIPSIESNTVCLR